MTKMFIASIIGMTAAPVLAPVGVGAGMTGPNYSVEQARIEGPLGQYGSRETSAARAIKLRQANALKAEADTFVRQDGGTLTAAHQTYLRKKSCEILGSDATPGGTLVKMKTC